MNQEDVNSLLQHNNPDRFTSDTMRVEDCIELNREEGLQCRYEAMRDCARNIERELAATTKERDGYHASYDGAAESCRVFKGERDAALHELSDLRVRLEALAAKWATSYAASGDRDIGYNSGTHQASIDLRDLLAKEVPKCEECEWLERDDAYPNDNLCKHPRRRFEHYCRWERCDTGNCGPTGRLFKRRGT